MTAAANTGTFEPVEITVKNYRYYEEETFNFEDITFCTINGQNGTGKSSLFMRLHHSLQNPLMVV